jgi:PEGA domain
VFSSIIRRNVVVAPFLVGFIFLSLECNKNNGSPTNSGNQNDPNSISVSISSIPVNGEIFVNGSSSGKFTPYTFSNLASGNYEFYIKAPVDYNNSNVHSFYLSEGDKKEINDTLKISWSGKLSYFVGGLGNTTYTIPHNLTAELTITYHSDANAHAFIALYTDTYNYIDLADLPNTNGIDKAYTFTVDKNNAGLTGTIQINNDCQYTEPVGSYNCFNLDSIILKAY